MINVVCTSKPCDGLLYYSYEYCCYLNFVGQKTNLIIITHPDFEQEDYFNSLTGKYTFIKDVVFNDFVEEGVTLLMGRSMLTHGFINRERYNMDQLLLLHLLFKNKIISVYSENHKIEYFNALSYFVPKKVVDLCDYDVYPEGEGKHFEKKIYFDIYKPLEKDIKFKFLFNGTNKHYYKASQKHIHKYPDHGIMVYDLGFLNDRCNHVLVPVDNLLGMFDTYVYTKDILDPAPRIIQECKFFNKNIIIEENNVGLETYMRRDITKINVEPILNEL